MGVVAPGEKKVQWGPSCPIRTDTQTRRN